MRYTYIIIIALLVQGCHSDLHKLKYKYSPEVINYFYETVYWNDVTGKNDKLVKWEKDISLYIDGDFSMDDVANIENVISQLNSLQLPIKLNLTPDSTNANAFVYFGTYSYLERKIGIADYEPFVGMGLLNTSTYIEQAKALFANDAKKYKRIGKTDSIKLRHAIILEEITQCLGIAGDSYHYTNSVFFEGGISTSSINDIDRDVLKLLYEPVIPSGYSQQQFEKDFGDMLYHINAPQKIADYVVDNNVPLHWLEYIREKSFQNSVLVKCPSEIKISLKGDYSEEDSLFHKNAINLFNAVNKHVQLVLADSIVNGVPGININYILNREKILIERWMTTFSTTMFPRRFIAEIKVNYTIKAPEINQAILNTIYKLLGFDANNTDNIMEIDSHGNISFKPNYKEILKLIYEPVFYSGLTLKEFDQAIEILKAKGYNE